MKNLNIIKILCAVLLTTATFSQNLAVYVSDAANFNSGPYQIAKFDETGSYLGALIDTDDGMVWPQDIVFLDNENAVLISNLGSGGNITKHDWASGEFIENFAVGLGGPTRMKIGPDGLLYILQWSNTNNKVLRYELDGTFVDEFTEVGVIQSIGIDWDSNGDLYVSSYSGSTVRKFDGNNGDDLGLFIDTGLQGPTNVFFEGNGNLIVFNYNSGIIKRFDSDGNFIADIVTGVTGCEGYDFFPNGDILIGVGSDNTVKRYDSNFNFLGNFIESGTLLTPNAIVIRDDIPLGVLEAEVDKNFIIPTIGTIFGLIENSILDISSMEVYNTIGILVDQVESVDGKMSWNADSFAEGLYFIVVQTKNGNRHTQKVIVKKKL